VCPRYSHAGDAAVEDGRGRDDRRGDSGGLPQITAEDVHEALLYAAAAVAERELPLRRSA
jgi:hypothetical protein